MQQPESYIFNATEKNFPQAVLLNSHKLPVFALYMGTWSEHCLVMADDLEQLAREFAGDFIFARIDIDEQAALRKDHRIENVPTLKVFRDGEVALTEEGTLKTDEIRTLLRTQGITHASDEQRHQAREKHMQGDTVAAIQLLTAAIQQDPSNTRIAMDMVQIFIDIGELEQADSLLQRLPDPDRKSETGRSLQWQIKFRGLVAQTDGKDALLQQHEQQPENLDINFDLAICHIADFEYQTAVGLLLNIVKQDADYKDGAAREMIIYLANMLGSIQPELAQEFRRQLGNVLTN